MKTRINQADFFMGVALFLLNAWYGVEAWNLPRVHLQDVIDSHIYPMVLCGVMGLLSLGLIIKSIGKREEKKRSWLPSKQVIGQIVFVFLALIVYILLFQKLGYLSSSIIFMAGTLKFLDSRRPLWKILLLSVLVSGICYVLFIFLFKLHVPPGILI